MERSTDGLGEMLQGLGIRPPKLEDAGLEDCALPPESIMEAFSRAATSLTSRIVDGDEADGDCVQDPGPSNGQIHDALIGPGAGQPTLGSCGGGNVSATEERVGEDKVVVIGDKAASASDRVLILGGEGEVGEKSCCPCQEGCDVGEKRAVVNDDDGDDGDGDGAHGDQQPILVEDLI